MSRARKRARDASVLHQWAATAKFTVDAGVTIRRRLARDPDFAQALETEARDLRKLGLTDAAALIERYLARQVR